MVKIDFMGIIRLLPMSAHLMEPMRPHGIYKKASSQSLKDCHDAVQWFLTGSNIEG